MTARTWAALLLLAPCAASAYEGETTHVGYQRHL